MLKCVVCDCPAFILRMTHTCGNENAHPDTCPFASANQPEWTEEAS